MAGRPTKKTETPQVVKQEVIVEAKVEPIIEQQKVIPQIKKAPMKRDMDEMIQVISLRPNPLIYVSKNQLGYQIEWDEYGSENWLEYRELINMKNSQSAFFKKNWIICDMEVMQDLKVDQYYKNMIDLENIEEVFSNGVDGLKQILSVSTDGIKQLIFDKALEMYKEKRLDSVSIKDMLKNDFNFEIDLVL